MLRRRVAGRVVIKAVVVLVPDVVGVADTTLNFVFRRLAERRMGAVDDVLDGEALGAFASPAVRERLAQGVNVEERDKFLKDKHNKGQNISLA